MTKRLNKPPIPIRKPTRLRGYDYSTPGMYFVTVCVQEKKHLLGRVVGGGDFDAPQVQLSRYGKILDKYIEQMSGKYPHIKMENYVIMPNHFHCLIGITEKNGRSETALPYNGELSKFISLLKRYCNREYGKNIWQRSFHDHIIRDRRDYEKIWDYIEHNSCKWESDCFYTE